MKAILITIKSEYASMIAMSLDEFNVFLNYLYLIVLCLVAIYFERWTRRWNK